LQQAGFYTLQGFNEEQKKRILNGYCANQLYQYTCVVVNNTITQGGFPPVFLAPMNFEALYDQQLKQAVKQTTPTATPAASH
jgi:preprotein translocase subunit SecB